MKKFKVLILLICVVTVFCACSGMNNSDKKTELSKKEQAIKEQQLKQKETEERFRKDWPEREILEILFTDIRGANTIIAYHDNEDFDTGEIDRVSVVFIDKEGSSCNAIVGGENLAFRKAGKKLEVVNADTVKVNYYDSIDKKNKYMTFSFSYNSEKNETKFVTKDFVEEG